MIVFFFFKQKTAYEMRISDWSSDVCSSDLLPSVGASAGYSREALSEHGKFAALGAPTSASDFWQLGFDASWELDLWGRARRSREGASAARSEERRVGKEGASTCRSRLSPNH